MSAADKSNSASKNGEVLVASFPVIDSKVLFLGSRKVQILHAGKIYILHRTRENKLILTK